MQGDNWNFIFFFKFSVFPRKKHDLPMSKTWPWIDCFIILSSWILFPLSVTKPSQLPTRSGSSELNSFCWSQEIPYESPSRPLAPLPRSSWTQTSAGRIQLHPAEWDISPSSCELKIIIKPGYLRRNRQILFSEGCCYSLGQSNPWNLLTYLS